MLIRTLKNSIAVLEDLMTDDDGNIAEGMVDDVYTAIYFIQKSDIIKLGNEYLSRLKDANKNELDEFDIEMIFKLIESERQSYHFNIESVIRDFIDENLTKRK